MALERGSTLFLVAAFVCVIFCIEPSSAPSTEAKNGNATSPITLSTTKPHTNHSSSTGHPTPSYVPTSSHVPTPPFHSTSISTATITPSHHNSSVLPSPSATSHPPNATSSVVPTTSGNMTVPTTAAPTPDCRAIREKLKKETQYKWIATAFSLIFAFVIVILVVVLCRMRRIYRELEGDSSLSRLI